MSRGMLILATAATLAAAPAATAAEGDVAFTDACGDNVAYLHSPAASETLPGTERSTRYDLGSAGAGSVEGGVVVRFGLCAPAGNPDGLPGTRVLTALLADDCSLTIGVAEPLAPRETRSAWAAKTCYVPNETGQCPLDTCTDTRFDVSLPAEALSVDGATITITVPRAGLTGEAAATFAPGAVWRNIGAAAAETGAFGFFAGADLAFSTPVDYAGSAEAFTIR